MYGTTFLGTKHVSSLSVTSAISLLLSLAFCTAFAYLLLRRLEGIERHSAEAFDRAIGMVGDVVRDTTTKTTEAIGAAVGAAVQTSLAAPPAPSRSPQDVAQEIIERWPVDALDASDPTDDIAWLRGERPGVAQVSQYDDSPFGVPGVGFPVTTTLPPPIVNGEP